MADEVRKLTPSSEWYEQPIGQRGSGVFDAVLQTNNMSTKHDDNLWNLMMNYTEELGGLALFM